jgi:Family of unknown function (DUF6411)
MDGLTPARDRALRAIVARLRVAPPGRGYLPSMTIAVVAAICILLLILAFVAPRLSSKPQRGVNRAFGAGGNTAGKAPGPVGRWLRKPFDHSNKAANKSAATGRKGRSKMPL